MTLCWKTLSSEEKSRTGGRWLYPTTRWAIYLRDAGADKIVRCVYCRITLDEVIKNDDGNYLTVDHVIPKSRGGTNKVTNLVTCCHFCNMNKARQTIKAFCEAQELDYSKVRGRLRRCRKRSVEKYREAAKVLLGFTPWATINPKVEDHDWIVRRAFGANSVEAQYWEHLKSQQSLFCPTCNRPVDEKGQYVPDEDIPF